ncbi:MAG: queuosine precursor transporter [Chloroflexota bacterium]|nr:queuosine precursor transporter [Chloroflexota bacterium]
MARVSSYFVAITALFITTLLVSNIIAVKLASLAGVVIFAAIVVFPISYICGDVLTEVYGYRRARRVIWLGFGCNLIAVFFIWLGQVIPPASFWEGQGAYEQILGSTPRILAASFLAYLVGEFANSFILAKMKIATQGRWLWSRTIGSTLVGEGLDTVVFATLALAGTVPFSVLGPLMLTQWVGKCGYEALATPLTYRVVNFLKRKEGLDVYDRDTNFNPLLLAEEMGGNPGPGRPRV